MVEHEPRLLPFVGYILTDCRDRDALRETFDGDMRALDFVPDGVSRDDLDTCKSALRDIYKYMRNSSKAKLLLGATWEFLVVAALTRLAANRPTHIHHDCRVYVGGTLLQVDNVWRNGHGHPYVSSLDVAEWCDADEHAGHCKLCSCKVSPTSFQSVDLAYVLVVWVEVGHRGTPWYLTAWANEKERIALRRKLHAICDAESRAAARIVTAETLAAEIEATPPCPPAGLAEPSGPPALPQ
ncbi:MAG TPA: hypothetical protein DGT21_24410 [Armatimonadetes bacterium]|nr:hypothetical protein [Armatimonadota bacterium]